MERYDDSYERACATSSTLSGRRKLETSICTSAICIHHRSCRIISLAKARNHAMPLSELAGQFSTTTSSKQRTSSEKIGRPFNFFFHKYFPIRRSWVDAAGQHDCVTKCDLLVRFVYGNLNEVTHLIGVVSPCPSRTVVANSNGRKVRTGVG